MEQRFEGMGPDLPPAKSTPEKRKSTYYTLAPGTHTFTAPFWVPECGQGEDIDRRTKVKVLQKQENPKAGLVAYYVRGDLTHEREDWRFWVMQKMGRRGFLRDEPPRLALKDTPVSQP